jgi:16S rRNA (adenine1518-N6/adenine1519-N6)-dimethyltransferase
LVDEDVARRIVAAADIGPREAVLEIGPGRGALTRELARRAATLYLVEVDPGLALALREEFGRVGHVIVVHADFLSLDLRAVLPPRDVNVVANLPYSVAIPILFRLLEERARFSRMTVMVQAEVAERLAARPGTGAYGALSVMVQLYARVRRAFVVAPESFSPRPKVSSEVVSLLPEERPRVPLVDEEAFRHVVRAAFGQRRKTLRNALKGLFAGMVPDPFSQTGIDGSRRAETLSLGEFAALADSVAAHLRGRRPLRPPTGECGPDASSPARRG